MAEGAAAIVPLRPGDEPGPVAASEEFVELYRAHYGRLVRALRYAGASAAESEDLAQEAFARTLDHWWRVRHGSNPAGYVYRVGFRLARRRRRELLLGDATPDTTSPDVGGEATTRVGAQAALAEMPAARRSCAVLCLMVGLSPNEAAHVLGIAASTVRKQLERARVDLHAALDTDSAANGEDGADNRGEGLPDDR